MRIFSFLLLSFFLSCSSRSHPDSEALPFKTQTLIDNLNVPWEILWGPDDHLWITERHGIVSRIHPESGRKTEILDLSGVVHQRAESGLLGMALYPDFQENPWVFLVYTYRGSGKIRERLVRYEYNGRNLENGRILINDIPGNTTHDGSRLLFLNDGSLLMTTGDAQDQNSAQDLSALSGKILRISPNGSIPSDNPIPGSFVYSWGHRNAQGLLLHPNGKVYSSEHGPDTDDEFNLILKGKNYGWPEVHGFCDKGREKKFCSEEEVIEPLKAWTPTLAVSDIHFYEHATLKAFEGKILMAVLKEKMVVALSLSKDGRSIESSQSYFKGDFGRIRDICSDPEGNLYLATNGRSWGNTDPGTHSIVKISPR